MYNNSYISVFCMNVKRLRQENKLSRAEMARKLGIGARSLSMVERGILPKRLNFKIVMTICREFGIPPEALFEFDE